MTDYFEQKTLIRYLKGLLCSRRLSQTAKGSLFSFFESSLFYLGISDDNEELLDLLDQCSSAARGSGKGRKALEAGSEAISTLLDQRLDELLETSPGIIETNLIVMAKDLSLSDHEKEFLGMMLRYRLHDPFYDLLNALSRENLEILEICSLCLSVDRQALRGILGHHDRLMASGVIIPEKRRGVDIDDLFDVPDILLNAFQKAIASQDPIRRHLIGDAVERSLEWEDFDHIAPARDRLLPFLREAVRQQQSGVNILLYGPAGTGKTEFCKTLASELQLNLYTLGECDNNGEEPGRKDRINRLRLTQSLLRNQQNSLLLFDEMEDLFENKSLVAMLGGRYSSGSKVFLHRLLENNPVPIIWTINNPSHLEDAVIRRMSLAVELKLPSPRTRHRVWQRQLSQQGIDLPDQDLQELARLEASPAIVSNAVNFARLSGGTLDDFRYAANSILKATKGSAVLRTEEAQAKFDHQLVTADCDLSDLASQVVKQGIKSFSLCLYGPPGTGKSAYVRDLAAKLRLPILMKRTSDLLSPWVGGTEENIAKAFEEASEAESFLIFDEADSLLGDRRKARAQWEVTQVNEMLTWMESHPLPFACTTNLMGNLDQAAMRRFTFKIRLDYLTSKQVQRAFHFFFEQSIDAEKARELVFLTPGDFAVVKKKASILGSTTTKQLIDFLNAETSTKNEAISHQIGFQMKACA